MASTDVDTLLLGQRIRHYRRLRCLTLEELGAEVGKPAPALSNIENGKREPRLRLINDIAAALEVPAVDLLRPEAPSRRAALEIEVERIQTDELYQHLALPYLKPAARIPDAALEHIVRLFAALRSESGREPTTREAARAANAELRAEMKDTGNYFADVENVARDAVAAVGYDGGAFTQGHLHAMAGHLGFTIVRAHDMPTTVRSVTDLRNQRLYVPQRDSLATYEVRSVVVQTLGHFALRHKDPKSFAEFLRQRVEANYFAGAVLLPESAAVPLIAKAQQDHDLSIEDLQDAFSVSYEMAAHRFTNLATEHLGMTVHFVRSDEHGIIWKAYENNDVPFPHTAAGAIEGQRLCREWGTRQAFHSDDKFAIHYQYTETSSGEYWCATHVDENRRDAITIGVRAGDAMYFRGHDTDRHSVSACPDGLCCRQPAPELEERWQGFAWPSVRPNSHVLAAMPVDTIPGVDITEIYEFLDRNAPAEPGR